MSEPVIIGRASEPLRVELSYPADQLSPNKRTHYMVEHRFKKAAKKEAFWATRITMPLTWAPNKEPVPIHLIVHSKPTGPHMDADNAIASIKAHLDGIAQAIGINDRDFDAPTVEWADRCARGKIIVVVG